MSPRRARVVLLLALLVALVLPASPAPATETTPGPSAGPTASATPTETPTAEPTEPTTEPTTELPAPTPTATPANGPFTVTDAQLRWGLNDESNNRAFAPGTVNFLSAGEVPDPGSGGNTVRNGVWSSTGATGWFATAGRVRIEKRRPDGSYALATFAGLSTQADGTALGGPTAGTFSGHQVVIDGGSGTVDPTTGAATISWTGTFSVLFYSGMSFFTVTDPRLDVTATTATLTGSVGGYASDMDDTSVWGAVPGVRVVLADLPRSSFTLPTTGGFSATPRYAGVVYDGPDAGQTRTGASWGSFPTSFVDQQRRVGAAAYWYSSGGSTDAYKIAKPLTVSYSAGSPIPVAAEPAPGQAAATSSGTKKGTKTPQKPTAPTPPTATTPTGSSGGGVVPIGAPLPEAAGAAPPIGALPAQVAAPVLDPRLPQAPTVYALTSTATPPATDPDHRWQWWLGSLLLLGAAGLSLTTRLPLHPSRSRGTP